MKFIFTLLLQSSSRVRTILTVIIKVNIYSVVLLVHLQIQLMFLLTYTSRYNITMGADKLISSRSPSHLLQAYDVMIW